MANGVNMSDKIEYVVAYAKRISEGVERILLVKKDRPEYMVGRYNLVGGKIEKGELPYEAAERELREEAGIESVQEGDLVYMPTECVGRIETPRSRIYVCVVYVNGRPGTSEDPEIKPREGETEEVFWKDWTIAKDSQFLMPNLRLVVPLILNNIQGWVIHDMDNHWDGQLTHELKLELPTNEGDMVEAYMLLPGYGYKSGYEEEE
jgi:8-oxo-dGTP pyrophosphatase MutT (NUDIX family)